MNRSSVYLLISVFFWGMSYIAIKIVLTQLEPVEMVSVRFLLATPTLYAIIRFNGYSIWPVEMKFKIFIAAMIVFLHFWIMATGMKETTASQAAWILTTAPIFVALLSWVYLKETFKLVQWGGVAVACLGVLVLTYNGSMDNLSWINSRADLIVLCSCVTWAFYTVGTREITAKVNPLVATFWMVAIAGMIWVPYTLFTTGYEKFVHLRADTYISLIFLGIFCLAIAFWLWSEGLKRLNAAEVGVWLYVEPLFTVAGAWIILGEAATVWLASGAVLISIGVWVAEKFGKTRHAEPGT